MRNDTPKQSAKGVDDPRLSFGSVGVEHLLPSLGKRMPLSDAKKAQTSLPNGQHIEDRERKVRGSAEVCAFKDVISWTSGGSQVRGVRGGVVLCGDQNFNVPDYEVPNDPGGANDGSWLLELSVSGIVVNTDDDDSFILPGIETGNNQPSWNKIAYTGSENYTDNTNPSAPTSLGTLVAPIGILTVSGATVRLVAVGCGYIEITQCGGILSHTRGGPS